MTEQEQGTSIAEACGWRAIMNADGDLTEEHLTRTWIEWIGPSGEQYSEPPDYLHDLNAMHEAEEQALMAKGKTFVNYCKELIRICEDEPSAIAATAAQRAEAFLRAIGKWKD